MPVLRVLLLTLAAGCLAGREAAAQTDLYGDPLPEGAIARMGSARFRHAGLSTYVIAPDDRTVVTAGGDRLLRYWDMATGKPRRAVLLQGKGGSGSRVTLAPDGKTVLAILGKQFVIWDADSGREVRRLPVPKNNGIAFVHFAPDGKRLAVGSWDLQTSIIDMQTGAARDITLPRSEKKVIRQGADSTSHGSFSPDGKWFICGGSWQDPLGIFDAVTGREVRRIACAARTSRVSPDSTRLVVSSSQDDKGEQATVIRLFDLASGQQTAQFPLAADDAFFALAFAPDGKTLACAFSDRACLLDIATGRVLHHLPGRPLAPGFTRDGKTLIASTGHRLRFWDVATGKELHDRPGEFGYNPVLAVSPDGRLLASGDWMAQTVSVWDTATGRMLHSLPLAGEGRYVRRVAFSADGKTLVACQAVGGYVQFWETATGKRLRAVQLRSRSDGLTGDCYDLHVAPDGRHVFTLDRIYAPTGRMTRLAAWDISGAKPVIAGAQTRPGEYRHVAWLAGGRLAVQPRGNDMSMVDVLGGVDAFGFASAARDAPLVVSPDERLVAGRIALAPGVRDDPRYVLWESTTGKEVAIVATDGFGQVALAPDNRCMVTTEYGVVIVRDMATGEVRHRWPMPASERRNTARTYFYALALSPDGRRAFTVQADGTALVWDLTPALRPAQPLVKDPGDAELAAWWNDLAGDDAAKAQRTVWSLVDAPKAALPFLAERIKPVARPDAKKVRRWIADLDSDDFDARQRAQQELSQIADRIEPAVREALKGNVPVEARRRLEGLLKGKHAIPSAEDLRLMRAIEVLDLTGTSEARGLLRALANGAPGARLTREARVSLERLVTINR